jgi:hypothetical protein
MLGFSGAGVTIAVLIINGLEAVMVATALGPAAVASRVGSVGFVFEASSTSLSWAEAYVALTRSTTDRRCKVFISTKVYGAIVLVDIAL